MLCPGTLGSADSQHAARGPLTTRAACHPLCKALPWGPVHLPEVSILSLNIGLMLIPRCLCVAHVPLPSQVEVTLLPHPLGSRTTSREAHLLHSLQAVTVGRAPLLSLSLAGT